MIKTLIKKHWSALALALTLGILLVSPFFYFESKLGSNFHGIFSEIVNDELFYYARIKDVVDGHPLLGNAYLSEYKSALPQQVFLAEYLLAQPIKLFNLNINTAHLIYNFLFPAIALILTYLALYLISKSRFWAIIFSLFLFFGLYLIDFIRPVSPQFNFIFWLTQFIFLWLLINSRNNPNLQMYPNSTNIICSIRMFIRRFGLLSANALNFGLLFYIYAYYWTFYLIFLLLLIAAYFFYNRELSYKIFSIIIGGLILATPYFYLNYLASKLPEYTETLTRLGLIYSRFPSGIRIVSWSLLGLLAFGFAIWRKFIKLGTKTIFFISGILASIIAVNQHLITGRNIEFSSHYSMGAIFFLVFAVAYLWQKLRERHNNLKLLSAVLLIIVLAVVASGLYGHSRRVFALNKEIIYFQNYTPIFNWLNKNTEKDSVVYANPILSRLIPVYAANNVFYAQDANLFFISDKEVLNRFILNNFFEDFNKNFITENVRSIYGFRYIDTYGHAVQGNKLRHLLGLKMEPEVYLPEEAIQKVVLQARELQKNNFLWELKKYRIDYFVWDKNKNPNWRVNERALKPVFQTENLAIYQVL